VRHGEGEWRAFDWHIAEVLENAYGQGHGIQVLLGRDSMIELDAMVQRVQHEGSGPVEHEVLRLVGDAAGAPDEEDEEEVVWLFETSYSVGGDGAGGGGWGLLDPVAAGLLEDFNRQCPSSTLLMRGPCFEYRMDFETMTQTNTTSGEVRRLRRLSSSSTSSFASEDMSESRSHGCGSSSCWVCRGSGRTPVWYSALMSQPSSGVDEEAEGPLCCACRGPGLFGFSPECGHRYCGRCAGDVLEAVLSFCKVPAFCLQCHADVTLVLDPVVGRMAPLPTLLQLLQARGALEAPRLRELFEASASASERALPRRPPCGGEDEVVVEGAFQCPMRCGRTLMEQDIPFAMVDRAPRLRMWQCPCDALVCPGCLQQVASATGHECGPGQRALAQLHGRHGHEASLATRLVVGKECPVCQRFCEKGESDWTMCSTTSRGQLAESLRRGGCGITFSWRTLQVGDDSNGYIDVDRRRRPGRPVTARQLNDHRRCRRGGCMYYRSADGCGPGLPFHTGEGSQGRNEGGDYCCDACARDGSHQPLCHRIPFHATSTCSEALGGGGRDLAALVDASRLPVEPLEPFMARLVRLTWPSAPSPPSSSPSRGGGVGGGELAVERRLHAQLVAEDGDLLLPALVTGPAGSPAEDLNFGAAGVCYDHNGFFVDCDFGTEKTVAGIKTDAGRDCCFTIHHSVDGIKWNAYVGTLSDEV